MWAGGEMGRLSMIRLRLWWERAFWVIPVVGVLVGVVLHDAVAELDDLLRLSAPGLPPEIAASSAVQLLAAIGGGMVTFTGFIFSFVVLLLQFGSSQYSPRTVSYFLRARSTQYILAVFLATITFSFVSLLDVGSLGQSEFTPLFTVSVAVLLLFVSLGAFIALLQSVGGRVRVDAVLSALGRTARRQLPRQLRAPRGATLVEPGAAGDAQASTIVRSPKSGQTVAVDAGRLLRIAARHGLRLVALPRVGDAVSAGAPLVRVDGVDALPPAVAAAVARAVVIEQERSLRHDPLYALRLLVDIAIRALSPAVNDPTTAVRSLDEIEGALRTAAGQELGPRLLRAGGGEVLLPSPSWDDLVGLALIEIMLSGAGQPQITRRIVALVDDVSADVDAARAAGLAAIRDEVAAQIAQQAFSPRLAAIVAAADRQGLGGVLGSA